MISAQAEKKTLAHLTHHGIPMPVSPWHWFAVGRFMEGREESGEKEKKTGREGKEKEGKRGSKSEEGLRGKREKKLGEEGRESWREEGRGEAA